MSLSHKLVGLLLLGCIGSTTILELVAVRVSTSILAEQQSVALEAVRSSRQHYLEQYFAIIDGQLRTFCHDPLTAEAVVDLTAAFERVAQQTDGAPERIESSDALREFYETEFLPRQDRAGAPTRSVDDLLPRKVSARILQSMYIARNPHAIGKKDRLDRAEATCDYNRLHGLYQPRMRDFLTTFGYYDIFLFDPDGNLVYSVAKEVDFATSFLDGPYAESNLATVYRRARAATTPDQVFMVEYDSYEPSHGAPASFIAAPIFRDGALVGVGAFQLPTDTIDAIVRDPSGLGKSGQVYLVGTNLQMQSNTRFREDAILRQDVATEAAQRALAGETGTLRQPSFSGEPVLASFAPVRIGDLSWGIVSEIDAAEIAGAAREVRNRVVVIGLVIALAIGLGLWLLLHRLVLRPVGILTEAARRLQDGDYTARVALPRSDEIGRLAGTFNHMAKSIERDTREREQSAAALRESESRYRFVAEWPGQIVFELDLRTHESRYFGDIEGTLRWSADEVGHDLLGFWTEHLHPEDRDRVLQHDQKRLRSLELGIAGADPRYSNEYRMVASDGSVIHIEEAGLVLMDSDGRLRKAVGIIRNITDRRKAEEALRKSEERFDLTVRGSGDGLWDYDPATGELWYAERFRELLGYHGEEEYPNVVESWSNGLHPDDRRATLDAFGAHLARDVPYDVEYRLKTSSGEYRWFRARGISLRDETGRSHRAAGSITDIHEQKQAEKELREREERFSSLVANIPGVVYRCELDEHWTMSFMSDRIEEISGYPASDFIGNRVRSFGSIIHPDDIAHVEQMVSEGLRENRYYVIEYRIVHADGSVRWVYEKGTAIDDGSHLDGVIFDVTERKRMEGALHEARQAAEAANEAKSAFLANMSHEIRTPMNGIIGMTELALDTDLTPEQREYLNTVQSSGDALLALINDILDFSKIEAGRIELDPDDFLLRDSISDTLSPLAMRAATKKLELAYDVHANVPDALVGDVYRLRQILVNLVGNAIKFTDEGEVVIEVGVAERQGDDVTLEIEVRDTGIGITPEAASRLFRAFEQAEISTTRKYGGTGLGLAISKQLVELMGGQIRLDSAPGEGSTFTFTVRFGVGKPRHSTTPRDAARVLNGKSVLIVDDNATNLRILTATVENWGLSSIQADSGAEALTQLDRASSAGQAISLVITDLHMPEIDGFDLVKSIRAHPSFSTLPVVLLSSSVSAGDKERCEELGIAARLLKPVKQSLLLDNIMRAIGSADHSEPMEAAEPTAESDAAQETSTLRVLLAEDNPVNQKFAVRVLERAGHSVVVANNGREAVDRSATDRFDVILMDVQMPEMDGLEATRAIRTRESEHPEGLPIIAMTANAMAGDREMCLEAGMDGYVPKPVKRDVLFAEIDRVLKEVQRGTDV